MKPNSTLNIDLDAQIAEFSGEIYSGGVCTVRATSAESLGSLDLRLVAYRALPDMANTAVAGSATGVPDGDHAHVFTLNLNTAEMVAALSDFVNGQQMSVLFCVIKFTGGVASRYLFKKYAPVTCWLTAVDGTEDLDPIEPITTRLGNRKVYNEKTYVYSSGDGKWHEEAVVGDGDAIRYVLAPEGIDLP